MASTKRSRPGYSAGEWGRNRVRAFADPRTGIIQVEWREKGRRRTRSLQHRDWAGAKRQADELAASHARQQPRAQAEANATPLTLEAPPDACAEDAAPAEGEQSRGYRGAAVRMFLSLFGGERDPGTLSGRDWDRFVRGVASGEVGPGREPLSSPTTGQEVKFLFAVLSEAWRTRANILRRYGSETVAMTLEACAAELEVGWRRRDDTTLTLTEAARESGYSADHLGRLVRKGKIPNAGRPGAPRVALTDLPAKARRPAAEPDGVGESHLPEISNARILQSIIDTGSG